jgi:type IV pilus assembly protein PilY1
MEKLKLRLLNLTAALLATLFCGHPAVADDTEVLIGSGGEAYVLFIIDTSGSMGGTVAGGTLVTDSDPSRLSIVQGVFANLMTSYEDAGINVAVMRFDDSDSTLATDDENTGGSFITPMQQLNSTTKSTIVDAVNALTANVHTPLAETLYEAALFFRGDDVHFGNLATPNNVTGSFVPGNTEDDDDTNDNDTYTSPITSQCQKNTIILLTDGAPTGDTDADTLIETLTGADCGDTDNCLDELAGFLHDEDQSPDNGDDGIAGTADDGIDGTQTVETYTIGFISDQTLLSDTATAGHGLYKTTTNAAQLNNAFQAALSSGIVIDANNTFAPPAMAANAFNNISHYNKLYFTLFKPSLNARWVGNVKPYQLTGSPPQLTDADGNVAINGNGLFLSGSRSFFSATDDGTDIPAGGANGQLPEPGVRKLYTYTGDTPADNASLNADTNALENSESSDLTPAMLGLTGDTADDVFDTVITATRSSELGDPLHSKPALITYGGSASNPDLTLFVATNGGFLHAFNANTIANAVPPVDNGTELFAFMPRELLDNLEDLANNTGSHPYGLDGDVTAWVHDDDNNGELYDTNDHVYVYVGMRRGGKNYYALDVTTRTAPTLKWVIKGGPVDEGGTTGFSELGQTWSRAAVTTIKYATNTGTGTKKVLIFGGGYDTDQDDHPTGTNDSGVTTYGLPDGIGRAIFIVDAETGERLWWAGPDGCI